MNEKVELTSLLEIKDPKFYIVVIYFDYIPNFTNEHIAKDELLYSHLGTLPCLKHQQNLL